MLATSNLTTDENNQRLCDIGHVEVATFHRQQIASADCVVYNAGNGHFWYGEKWWLDGERAVVNVKRSRPEGVGLVEETLCLEIDKCDVVDRAFAECVWDSLRGGK